MYVYDQAHALAKAICQSEEYKIVKGQKAKIDSDPELKKMFNDYRTKQFEIQKMQIIGQQVPEATMQMFRQMHDIVVSNSALLSFLEAENRFATVMGDIQKILVDGLDLG